MTTAQQSEAVFIRETFSGEWVKFNMHEDSA